jgi:ubiquinone/menaquinone biosynthesis C-methylase UbiE
VPHISILRCGFIRAKRASGIEIEKAVSLDLRPGPRPRNHPLRQLTYFVKTGYMPSGERVIPDFPDENFQNHLKVYKFLLQFAHEADVLDCGCGTGYGTALLAEKAKSIVGIDISKAALTWAKKHYPAIEYLQMNVEELSFQNNSFDLIVSSENFEHLHDQKRHVSELARVLRPNGLCFVASPNPEMTIGETNKYHTKENTYPELIELFSSYFNDITILENQLDPTTLEGKQARERRFSSGLRGPANSAGIDTTWLHNTHSFFCFLKAPKGK